MIEQIECQATTVETYDVPDEIDWPALWSGLHTFVNALVRDFAVPSWYGQEEDVVDDIVQESIRKIIERIQKAELGLAAPIQSLKQISATIAYNTYRDYRRKDRRLCHLQDACPSSLISDRSSPVHPLDYVTEQLYDEQLFDLLARDIATFPPKQKQALLMDLANRMSFAAELTPLQQALLHAGITIQAYRQSLPEDKTERYRYASILNHAYRRVRIIAQQRGYI